MQLEQCIKPQFYCPSCIYYSLLYSSGQISQNPLDLNLVKLQLRTVNLFHVILKIVGVLLGNDESATQALDFMQKYIDQTNQKPDILPGITLELVHYIFTGTGNSFSGLQKSKFI